MVVPDSALPERLNAGAASTRADSVTTVANVGSPLVDIPERAAHPMDWLRREEMST
jgi:hypothetical protein